MDLMAHATRGRKLSLSQTCAIKRSGGSVTGYTTPATVHSSLSCSYVWEMSDEERERAGLTSITRPVRCYVEMPTSGVIQQHDVLVANSVEYRIENAKTWTTEEGSYYELIMERQG